MSSCFWNRNGLCLLKSGVRNTNISCEYPVYPTDCPTYTLDDDDSDTETTEERKETNTMNEQLMNLINGLGAVTEMWMVIFANFKAQNMDDDDAIKHTKAMMEVLMGTFMPNVGEGEKE